MSLTPQTRRHIEMAVLLTRGAHDRIDRPEFTDADVHEALTRAHDVIGHALAGIPTPTNDRTAVPLHG